LKAQVHRRRFDSLSRRMALAATATVQGLPATRGRDGGIRFPPPGRSGFGIPGPYVYDALSARRVPAVGRAIQLYAGLTKQCPREAYRGFTRLPTPRICERPMVGRGGAWFVGVNVEDYLLNGNAVNLVVARGTDGWPLAVRYLPINYVYLSYDPQSGEESYSYLGMPLPFDDVIHVRRGIDRWYPVRGVGVVEEYISSLDRIAMEEEYERGALSEGAVPSVAVITPQSTLTQEVADQAKEQWVEKFGGPVREPVILPNGTVVQPLAWSPTDTQLAEARRLSLLDVANMFNLDGYWLGAPVAGMTYRTAGPQYQQILRTSLEPVMIDFEEAWSDAWLPRGQRIRFDRSQLLREDLATSTTAAVAAYKAGIITAPEARAFMDLPPDPIDDGELGPPAPEPTPIDDSGGTS
jgi:HK97 family phage portal protein